MGVSQSKAEEPKEDRPDTARLDFRHTTSGSFDGAVGGKTLKKIEKDDDASSLHSVLTLGETDGAVGGRTMKTEEEKNIARFLHSRSSPDLSYGRRNVTGYASRLTQSLALDDDKRVYKSKKESTLVCAAIDFGTSNTGYAYSFRAKPKEIITNYWYGHEIKTPTVVLLHPDKSLYSFGKEARDKYEALMKTKSHEQWYLFERFKMKLYTKEGPLDKDIEIEDILGKRMKAIDIFTMAIRYIKDHLMKELSDSDRMKEVNIKSESDIHWLLTVPAIWNDLSKRFMRTAANNAGIPDEMLSLALEPEAASVFCKEELGLKIVPVGCRYIVLDLGGGTGDITVHEVNPDERLKELHQPTGGDFGGTNVDNKFKLILVRLFGAEVVSKFKYNHMQEYWELMTDFEIKKKKFDGTGRMILKFPTRLLELYEDEVGFKLEASLQQTVFEGKIEFKLGKMFITEAQAKELFQEAATKVREFTQDILDKVENISHIIMVGGFSESPYLQSEMRNNFDNLIVLPEEPSGAVLKGAVLYGQDSGQISARVCKKTYGIARMMKFKPDHPLHKKITIGNRDYCDDLFNKHIEIGTKVSIDSENDAKEHEYFPPTGHMKQAVLEVYASSKRDPKFVDEDDCEFVGLIKIDIDPQGDIWSKIMVKMLFGGTELRIKVRDVKQGHVTTAAVDFLG
ncbi:HS12A-like protein [Mya arenaria]|uniref:HS12A-like protein n=1 Tax=Mya arenaria TaxID=6604 RepID=A0ABY7DS51_MYAAR|nr:HS12A-like protein [Mya arenaria]